MNDTNTTNTIAAANATNHAVNAKQTNSAANAANAEPSFRITPQMLFGAYGELAETKINGGKNAADDADYISIRIGLDHDEDTYETVLRIVFGRGDYQHIDDDALRTALNSALCTLHLHCYYPSRPAFNAAVDAIWLKRKECVVNYPGRDVCEHAFFLPLDIDGFDWRS